jgi:hypothetical protein
MSSDTEVRTEGTGDESVPRVRYGRSPISVREVGDLFFTAIHFDWFRLGETHLLSIDTGWGSITFPSSVTRSEITSQRDAEMGRHAYRSVFQIPRLSHDMQQTLERACVAESAREQDRERLAGEVARLHKEGLSARVISTSLGVKETTVYRLLGYRLAPRSAQTAFERRWGQSPPHR